ncbi:restriction endonuclease subunit S [Desulforamulus aeronauticus]|uniref:Type I restriction enzyme, S subunit n=1 Tax=Desulforamulus aeronauticus DSM 10349 TaxID=1121421 RepID=A0A1M6RAI2_9FIRM|nr:restriction endonuclease subunit S [Desulforamulus aeronauticus]SHK29483.1 type I restriction enzyme, S subunit [Desulforamulus aeronauticus DSM 10349]
MSDVTLSSVCVDIFDCEHKTAPTSQSGYPSIRTPNIGRGFIIFNDLNLVDEDTYKAWTRRAVPQKDDIIFAREAPVGNAIIIPENFYPCLGQRTVLIRPNSDIVNPRYLLYSLLGNEMQAQIHSLTNGATVHHLNVKDIKNLKIINFHERAEQDKIAEMITVYDNLIENNNRRIAILEKMAQKLYRNESLKSETTCLLGELVRFRRGKTITKATISEGNVPVVAGGIQPAYYHNRANAKAPVLTVSASGANAGYVNLYHADIWASDCSFIDINDTENVYYFYVAMKDLQNQITFMQRGSAQPHVYPDDISRLEIPALSRELVDNLNKILTDIFNSIGNLKSKNEVLHKTRDHLLPRLISGDIDVSKIEL